MGHNQVVSSERTLELGLVSKSGTTPPMGGGRGVEAVYTSTRKKQKSSALTVTRRELWRMMPMRTYLRREEAPVFAK